MMKAIERAIYATLAYADVFQFPLTEMEIHRYLIGMQASREEVHNELQENSSLGRRISAAGGYYLLAGRDTTIEIRSQRKVISEQLWPHAIRYGKWIANLPYVRMVAVTGSLAMDNAASDADLDYLVVTQPSRLWLTRAFVILLVRLASRTGKIMCPNYFISENNLNFTDRNLFTAHELIQMIPLSGLPTYEKICQLNSWAWEYLPNARTMYGEMPSKDLYHQAIKPILEAVLKIPPSNWIEKWEMDRKIHRFQSRLLDHPEANFGPDLCKGHFDDHGMQIQRAYADRMLALEEVVV